MPLDERCAGYERDVVKVDDLLWISANITHTEECWSGGTFRQRLNLGYREFSTC